ncbi:MAG: MFS transporter [Pseudomonadota bacterium]
MRWYLAGVASWFIPQGMLSVLVPWIVGHQLHLDGARYFGYAYLVFTLPTVLCVLLGGWVADRYDERRVLLMSQGLLGALAAALGLITFAGHLTYGLLLAYLCCVGTASAFVRPARDSLVGPVSGGQIQRFVTASTAVQFGVQVIGFTLAGWVERTGAGLMFKFMALMLLMGALAALRLPAPGEPRHVQAQQRRAAIRGLLHEPLSVLRVAPGLTPVMLVNLVTGICYNGAYFVIVPKLVLELEGSGARELAFANTAFMLGTLAMTIELLRRRGLARRHVTNLFLAIGANGIALTLICLSSSISGVVLGMGLWGMGTGVAIALGRTIVQERSPTALRARLLAMYMLTFMAGTPIGSVTLGLLAERIGVVGAGVVAAAFTMAAIVLLAVVTDLRRADAFTPNEAGVSTGGG